MEPSERQFVEPGETEMGKIEEGDARSAAYHSIPQSVSHPIGVRNTTKREGNVPDDKKWTF